MTRINVIPPRELSDKHLVAEYRELPRLYALSQAWRARGFDKDIPAEYTLGKGHVLFFYGRLIFIWKRHWLLCHEMQDRSFTVNYWPPQSLDLDFAQANDYLPTREALRINRERINKRLNGDKS